MNPSKVEAFLQDIKLLQAKYGITICADYEEDWDYNFDDEPIIIGIKPRLVLCDMENNYYSLDTDEIYM